MCRAEMYCLQDEDDVGSDKEIMSLRCAVWALNWTLRVQMEMLQPSGDEMLENDLDSADMFHMHDEEQRQEFSSTLEKPISGAVVLETVTALLTAVYSLCAAVNVSLDVLTGLDRYLADSFLKPYQSLAQQAGILGCFQLRWGLCQTRQAMAKYENKSLDLPAFFAAITLLLEMADMKYADPGLLHHFVDILMHSAILLAHEAPEATSNWRWKLLSRALDELTAATKIPGQEDLRYLHTLRGDCEMLRYQMSQGSQPFAAAVSAQQTLIKNASVFYGAARQCSPGPEDQPEDVIPLDLKRAIAARIMGTPPAPEALAVFSQYPTHATKALTDALKDGLISQDYRNSLSIDTMQRSSPDLVT